MRIGYTVAGTATARIILTPLGVGGPGRDVQYCGHLRRQGGRTERANEKRGGDSRKPEEREEGEKKCNSSDGAPMVMVV